MNQSCPPAPSFESYWLAHQARFMAMARTEWEARADGPFQGTVNIELDEGLDLDIPLHMVVNGLSAKAVAHKIAAYLSDAKFIGDYQREDEWRELVGCAKMRLDQENYDFSEGCIFAVDIHIGLAP